MQNRPLLLFFAFIIITGLACNLIHISDTASVSEIEPASMDGWVAYNGRGVRVGAPANLWTQIPFDATNAETLLQQWQETDPTVANVFDALITVSQQEDCLLVLMKRDGTAWMTVTYEEMPFGTTFDAFIEQRYDILATNGTRPRARRRIPDILAERAIRWEVAVSPIGSQIINRQFHYLVLVGNTVYTLTFNAQAADFDSYKPIFEAMALSFGLT